MAPAVSSGHGAYITRQIREKFRDRRRSGLRAGASIPCALSGKKKGPRLPRAFPFSHPDQLEREFVVAAAATRAALFDKS